MLNDTNHDLVNIQCGQVFYNACDLDTLYQVTRLRENEIAFQDASGKTFWAKRDSEFVICLQRSCRKLVR